jgi:hypothetical protein
VEKPHDWAIDMENKINPQLEQVLRNALDASGTTSELRKILDDNTNKMFNPSTPLLRELPYKELKQVRDKYVGDRLPYFIHTRESALTALPLVESASNNVVVVSAKVPRSGVYANQLVLRDAVSGDILEHTAPYHRAHTIGVTLAASPPNSSDSSDHRVAVAVRGMVPVVHPYEFSRRSKFCEGDLLYAGDNWHGVDTAPLVAIVRSHALHLPFEKSLEPLWEGVKMYPGKDTADKWRFRLSDDLDAQISDGSIVHNVSPKTKRHFKCMSGGKDIYAPALDKFEPDAVAAPPWQIVTLAKLYHDDNYVDIILP